MISIQILKQFVTSNFYYSCFSLQPFQIGQALTVGNALRRIIIASFPIWHIISLKINNIVNELNSIAGLQEDYFNFLLNLREIIFRETYVSSEQHKIISTLYTKGPILLNSGMLRFNTPAISVLNPKQYLGTLVTSTSFYLELILCKKYNLSFTNLELGNITTNNTLLLNQTSLISFFPTVKNVNFKIKLLPTVTGKFNENLIIEIWTDGSYTPKRVLVDSLKILTNIFSNLLVNSFTI